MNLSPDNSSIADRIKYLMRQNKLTQAAFARRIGIDPSNLSKHLTGRMPITDVLLNRIVVDFGVSKQWLRDGTDTPYSKEAGLLSLSPTKPVPIYDVDVTAGDGNLDMMFTDENIMGHLSLPRIGEDAVIVHVSGDSMLPDIENGALLVIRPVTDSSMILYGQIHVVVTDSFRRVKFLRRHPKDPSKVILHSANPNYDDVDLPRKAIKRLFRVEAILNFKVCG